MFAKAQTAALLNSALDEIDAGAQPCERRRNFSEMRRRSMSSKYALNIYPQAARDMEGIFEYIAVQLCNSTAAEKQIRDF